jgi:hypothetical protein
LTFRSGRYGRLGRNIVTIELNKDFVEVAFPARIEVDCTTSFVDDHIQSLMRNFDWGIANPNRMDGYLCNAIRLRSKCTPECLTEVPNRQVAKSRWSTSSQPRRSHLILSQPLPSRSPKSLALGISIPRTGHCRSQPVYFLRDTCAFRQ